MTVRKFSAKSMQAAIAMVKDTIGEEAVILTTRRVPKGPLDPYGHDLFEVEAAPAGYAEVAPARPQPVRRNLDLDEFIKKDLESPPPPNGEFHGILDEIRQMLYGLSNQEDISLPGYMDAESVNLYARLVNTGLSDKRARSYLNQSLAEENCGTEGPLSLRDKTKNLLSLIIESVDVIDSFGLETERIHALGPEVHAFTGPTGAGKTTTIAKLAAELHLKRNKKVGLVSIDSYRIGALDQLKTYSSIMGLPCLSAFSPGELETALEKLSAMDVVLVDTAGQSHLDEKRMAELKDIMKSGLSISTHLVLNATMGRLDMREVADSFSSLSPETYVFTKIDETRRRGNILDQVNDRKMPVSLITNGQNVPEDLIVATKKSILDVVFGKIGR